MPTVEEIARVIREKHVFYLTPNRDGFDIDADEIATAIAALYAEERRAAVLEEREACAQIVAALGKPNQRWINRAEAIAAIRARTTEASDE